MNHIDSNSLTHRGTVRKNNQDAILAFNEYGLWAVADGMGGHDMGELASRSIINYLHTTYENQAVNSLQGIKQAIYLANQEIYQYSLNQQSVTNKPVIIGSTVVVLLLLEDQFHCFWCGDSRCYLYRNQQLHQISQDHTKAEEMIMNGSLSRDNAKNIPAANILTHAIGVEESPMIEYRNGYIYQGDTFYLCSDGINLIVDDEQLAALLNNADIQQANHQIFAKALSKGSPDNISSIIVKL